MHELIFKAAEQERSNEKPNLMNEFQDKGTTRQKVSFE